MKAIGEWGIFEATQLRCPLRYHPLLAQAYLELSATRPSMCQKAERTLDEIMIVEISVKVCRHKLRLLIKRCASDTEMHQGKHNKQEVNVD